MPDCQAAVIGAGPAGLMAAETLAEAGAQVDVFDGMPSAGRKFLLAGKGGLNLTHAEPEPLFHTRYREAVPALQPALAAFGPQALRDWAQGLVIDTFVGTSGRVFPQEMKAAFAQQASTDQGPLRARAVADFIAGMTDRFAAREHERLTGRRLLG